MNHFTLKFWILLALAALLALLATSRSVSGQVPADTGANVVISGFLACDDVDARRTCYTGIHYVDLVEGQTYDFRIDSSQFDVSLTMEDLKGTQLAADTDDLDWSNGRIVFRAPATASYRLLVGAREPMREGYYTISLRPMPALMQVRDALTSADELVGDCRCRTYDVPMTAGRRYVIDLQSDQFEAFVKLTNLEGAIVAFADEARPGGLARIIYEAPRTETFRIVCTTAGAGQTGVFALGVFEE